MNREAVANELVRIAEELVAMDFPTQNALDKYLKDHPDADKSNHTVKETKDDSSKKEESDKQMKYRDRPKEEQRELEKKFKRYNQYKYNFANNLLHNSKFPSKSRITTSSKKYHDAFSDWEKEVSSVATPEQKSKIKKIHENLDAAEKEIASLKPAEGGSFSQIRQLKEMMSVYNKVNNAWHDKINLDSEMGRYL